MDTIWVCKQHLRDNARKILIWSGQQCFFCNNRATHVAITQGKVKNARRFVSRRISPS